MGYTAYFCNDKDSEDGVDFNYKTGKSSSVTSEWDTSIEYSSEFKLTGKAELGGFGGEAELSFGVTLGESFMKGEETSSDTEFKISNHVTAPPNTEIIGIVQISELNMKKQQFDLEVVAAGHLDGAVG